MSEERVCTYYAKDTKLYKSPPCNAKILRRELVLSSEKAVQKINASKSTMGGRVGEEMVSWYLYQCENSHILIRPDGWADVQTVPPGTIKSIDGARNKPPQWYIELSEKQKEKVWR